MTAPGAMVLWWGAGALPLGLALNHPIIRVEDGFLRSVGLGAELTRPLSWVMDTRGIYYDATRPSDLEHLLQHVVFSSHLIKCAVHLHQRLLEHGITKYNLRGQSFLWSSQNKLKNNIMVQDIAINELSEFIKVHMFK